MTHNADKPDALIGVTIDGRYQIRRVIGHGGMGVVYEALHTGLDTPVAVKVLNPKYARRDEALKRFQMEARVASSLKHRNVIVTHAFGILENKAPYLVMEYVDGKTLADYLSEKNKSQSKTQKKFDKNMFISIFTQCCSGLAALHEQGVIHRDIKPSNIMLVPQPDGQYLVKVTDFGIVKHEEAEQGGMALTRTGELIGTPMYMSAEQCEGRPIDHRSDIYSLGCVMYEMLCGRPPFESETPFEVMLAHVNDAPESPTEKHVHLRKLRPIVDAVLHALQKDPDARPKTMEAMRNELLDAAKGVSNFKRKRILRLPAWSWKIAGAIAGMVLIMGAALALSIRENQTPDDIVDGTNPDALFTHAEQLQAKGRTEQAAREYSRSMQLMFKPELAANLMWVVKPEYLDEQHLQMMFKAAQGCDGMLSQGWPVKDYWYRAINALQAYYAKTHDLPSYVAPMIDQKFAATEALIAKSNDRTGAYNQLDIALKLEGTFAGLCKQRAQIEKDPSKRDRYLGLAKIAEAGETRAEMEQKELKRQMTAQ